MAAFNKVNAYSFDKVTGKHVWNSHVYKAMLTNVAPTVASAIKADITDIGTGNGYSAGGMTLDSITLSQSGLTTKCVIADEVLTASGGTIGPFRYVVIYNDSQTSPAKPIVGWYDYGSAQTLADGEPFTIDFDGTLGFWTEV